MKARGPRPWADAGHRSPSGRGGALLPTALGAIILPAHWAFVVAGALVIALLQEHARLLQRIEDLPWPARAATMAVMLFALAA